MPETALIQCNSSYLNTAKKLGFTDAYLLDEDVIEIAIPDVDSNLTNEQLVTMLGIDSNQVYNIEYC